METIRTGATIIVFFPRYLAYQLKVRTCHFSGHDLHECPGCRRQTLAWFNRAKYGPEPGLNPGGLHKQCLHPSCGHDAS